MSLHRHARLSPFGLALLVYRILVHGLRIEEAAQTAGVRALTAYKWLKRRAGGRRCLAREVLPAASLPSRDAPDHRPGVGSAHLRRIYRQIAGQPPVALSTITRLVRHAGLRRLADLEPSLPENHYENAQPRQLLHLDIKDLARVRQPGHRVTDSRQINSDGMVWGGRGGHLVHSRIAFLCVGPDERSISACRALLQAIRNYWSLGARFERVLTDNEACYKSRYFR